MGQVRSAVVEVFSLQYACVPVIQDRVALVCVVPVLFWVRAQVRSGHGQVGVCKKRFQLVRSCLSGRYSICVSELVSLDLGLDLVELGYFWRGKVK